MDPLDTDSCDAVEQFPWNLRCLTVQCSIGNFFKKETDDTRIFLRGASCTIAAMIQEAPFKKYTREGSYHIFLNKLGARRQIRQINSAILKVPDGALNR